MSFKKVHYWCIFNYFLLFKDESTCNDCVWNVLSVLSVHHNCTHINSTNVFSFSNAANKLSWDNTVTVSSASSNHTWSQRNHLSCLSELGYWLIYVFDTAVDWSKRSWEAVNIITNKNQAQTNTKQLWKQENLQGGLPGPSAKSLRPSHGTSSPSCWLNTWFSTKAVLATWTGIGRVRIKMKSVIL